MTPHLDEYDVYFAACERAQKRPLPYGAWLKINYPNEKEEG